MRVFAILLSVVFAATAISDREQWVSFKVEHSKTYRSLREETVRFKIFQDNLRRIEAHNTRYEQGDETYMMGVNQFADLTQEEFENQWSMPEFRAPKPDAVFSAQPNVQVASSVDWREKGVVVDVENQLRCGACWAFSAVGSIEGQYAIKHNQTIALSPQELVDCSISYGTVGCNGGWMYEAYNYVRDHGISAVKNYRYDGLVEPCRNDSIPRVDLKVTGYTFVDENEEALRQAIEKIGPIAVTFNLSGLTFYYKGILSVGSCPDVASHAVLVVGYGSENGTDYWIIKNSWGSGWGENGYFRMLRDDKNSCGIYSHAMFPNIA